MAINKSHLRLGLKRAIYACSDSKLKRGLAFKRGDLFKQVSHIESQILMLLKLKRRRL